MKNGLVLAIILFFSLSADAHPGKTDRQGGHKCWKNCGEWELNYEEYHLHDEGWKPIRLDSKGNPLRPVPTEGTDTPGPEKQFVPPEPVKETDPAAPTNGEKQKEGATKIVIERHYEIIARDESILPFGNVLLLALAMLLLIALFFIRRRKD